jgi:hypothetical protein
VGDGLGLGVLLGVGLGVGLGDALGEAEAVGLVVLEGLDVGAATAAVSSPSTTIQPSQPAPSRTTTADVTSAQDGRTNARRVTVRRWSDTSRPRLRGRCRGVAPTGCAGAGPAADAVA